MTSTTPYRTYHTDCTLSAFLQSELGDVAIIAMRANSMRKDGDHQALSRKAADRPQGGLNDTRSDKDFKKVLVNDGFVSKPIRELRNAIIK